MVTSHEERTRWLRVYGWVRATTEGDEQTLRAIASMESCGRQRKEKVKKKSLEEGRKERRQADREAGRGGGESERTGREVGSVVGTRTKSIHYHLWGSFRAG